MVRNELAVFKLANSMTAADEVGDIPRLGWQVTVMCLPLLEPVNYAGSLI